MKETISVNLASQAFTFDKDAYRRLKEYLDAIRRRLPAGDPEILNDVEARLAEIFRSRISSPMMVVSPMTTPSPWSMNTLRPISAPGWISIPVLCRARWLRMRASSVWPFRYRTLARRWAFSAFRPG